MPHKAASLTSAKERRTFAASEKAMERTVRWPGQAGFKPFPQRHRQAGLMKFETLLVLGVGLSQLTPGDINHDFVGAGSELATTQIGPNSADA